MDSVFVGWYFWATARGLAADYCRKCRKPQLFVVRDHYKKFAFCFIPVPPRIDDMTMRQCCGCGDESLCEKGTYPGDLPGDQPAEASLLAVAQESNPPLHHLLALLHGNTLPEEPARKAVSKLVPFYKSPQTQALVKKLKTWPQLDGQARQRLLQETQAITAAEQKHSDTVDYFLAALDKAPQGVLHFLAVFLLGFGLFAATVFFGILMDSTFVWLFLVFGSLALCIAAYIFLNRWAWHRWTKNVLLPSAYAADVSLEQVKGALTQAPAPEVKKHERYPVFRKKAGTVLAILATEEDVPDDEG